MLRQRIAHIFSIRYGKLHGFFNSEKRERIIEGMERGYFHSHNIILYLFISKTVWL